MTATNGTPPVTRAPHRGTWRTLASGWTVFLPTVVGAALVQALLVVDDPVPAATVTFVLLAAASLATVLAAVWLTTGAAAVFAGPAGPAGPGPASIRQAVRRPSLLLWAGALSVIAAAAVLVDGVLPVLVMVIGVAVLPAGATVGGPGAGLRRLGRAVRRHPVRYLLLIVAAAALVVVSWLVALLLGFFVTGWLSAGLTWLWFGLVATVLLCWSCSLIARVDDSQ